MRTLKKPRESGNYRQQSEQAIAKISAIIKAAICSGDNKIFMHTNLKLGLPLENINKVAGPFVEAWAQEKFQVVADTPDNNRELLHVQTGARLDPYDIILQFHYGADVMSANVDVKATAKDIATSGKSPNITSYGRIRTEYVNDPDYIFIVLSLKHIVYGEKIVETGMTNGVMEVVDFSVFDLKYVSEKDISYNPALGTGQIQIRDINYVTQQLRTTQEFCDLLDKKYTRSKGDAAFERIATKLGWLEGTAMPDEPIEVLV